MSTPNFEATRAECGDAEAVHEMLWNGDFFPFACSHTDNIDEGVNFMVRMKDERLFVFHVAMHDADTTIGYWFDTGEPEIGSIDGDLFEQVEKLIELYRSIN